jgi:hypothetical protein
MCIAGKPDENKKASNERQSFLASYPRVVSIGSAFYFLVLAAGHLRRIHEYDGLLCDNRRSLVHTGS